MSEAAATALECSALVPDDNRPRIINCDPWSIVTKLPLSNNESMHSYGLTNPTPSLLFQLLTRNSINARCTYFFTHQTYLGANHEAPCRLLPPSHIYSLDTLDLKLLNSSNLHSGAGYTRFGQNGVRCAIIPLFPTSRCFRRFNRTVVILGSFLSFLSAFFRSHIFTIAFYTAMFFRFDPNFP